MAISWTDSTQAQPPWLCRAAKSLFKQLVQTQELFQQSACCKKPQDYSAREGEPAKPELCHLIREEFVRKLCELIRESDSSLTKSLRKSPAAVMSYCVPCLGGRNTCQELCWLWKMTWANCLGIFLRKGKRSACDSISPGNHSHTTILGCLFPPQLTMQG